MDTAMRAAQGFIADVLAAGTWPGDGGFPRAPKLAGAEALAGMVLERLPDPGRSPELALDLFGAASRGDPATDVLRNESLGVILTGALALGLTGHPVDDLIERLVLTATGLDDELVKWRSDLFRRRPVGPPDPVLPEWTIPMRELLDSKCMVGVVKAVASLGRLASQRLTVDAAGITDLAPHDVCPGTQFQIQGSGFGATQAADVRVLLPTRAGGCREVAVDSWTDTVLLVTAPSDIGPGCIGFVRGFAGYSEPTDFSGMLASCIGPVGQQWGAALDKARFPMHSCPPCLPGGENRITAAGSPFVHFFRCTPEEVEPGGQPQISWSVSGATSVKIEVMSGSAPTLSLPTPAHTGSVTWPPVTGTSTSTTEFRLTAQNACGVTVATTGFTLTRRPHLAIDAIEVVQSEQLPDNSVRLVGGRRTAVRVFVNSGITDGFNLGDGPGAVGGLDVSLYAQNLGTGSMTSCGAPWNPDFLAKPTANRDVLSDSLNFEVPLSASRGNVRFLATVSAPAQVAPMQPTQPPISFATGSVDVTFIDRPQQEILPFLITDPGSSVTPPALSDVFATMDGPVRMHPFPAGGLTFNLPALPLALGSMDSLWSTLGWERLVARLTLTTFLFPNRPVGGVRVAIAPTDAPLWGGMALPRFGLTTPSMIIVAGQTITCTHELGHAFGLQHVNAQGLPSASCSQPAGPYDARLPFTLANPGLDVPGRSLLPSATAESMTYCSPQWTSRQHWDLIFDTIPAG